MGYVDLNSSDRHDWQTPESVWDLVNTLATERGVYDPCPAGGTDGLEWWPDLSVGKLCYVNSPFGRELPKWIKRCAEEASDGAEVLQLTPARPDTRWFHDAYATANALCFWRGRMRFVGAEGPAPFPTMFWYWGDRPHWFAHVFGPHGIVQVIRDP